MNSWKGILFTTLMSILILAGCVPGTGQPVPATPETTLEPEGVPAGLVGSEWILAEMDGAPAVEGVAVTLSFPNPGELSGNAGCNNYFARYVLMGEVFALSEGGLETTTVETMGCNVPEHVLDQESAYFSVLQEAALIREQGERLAFLDSNGQTRLVFEPKTPVVVDPALVSSSWSLTLLSEMPLLPETHISLEFQGETAGGSAGCNGYGATLLAADERHLSISEIMSTAKLCTREDGVDVMGQEAAYLGALQNSATYQVSEGQLEIFDPSGNRILVFQGEEQRPMDPVSLIGTSWQLLSFDGESPQEGVRPTLAFLDEGRLEGNSGCRDFTGNYQAEGDQINFPQNRMVQLDCLMGEEARAMEGKFTDALTWANRYAMGPDRLVIYTSRGEELVFEPLAVEPGESEASPDWRLAAFLEGEVESPQLSESEITLGFERGLLDEKGRVSGSSGCNSYSAAYAYDGSNFRFEQAAATKMACLDPEGVMEQEQRFLEWLEKVTLYRVEGGRLYLEAGEGQALVFEELD